MNTKIILSGIVFLICGYTGIFAQENNMAKPQILVNLARNDGQDGQIELIQPEQVENILKMQIANNYLQKGVPGYRIRIFSQSGQTARQRCEETQRNFMRNFPGMQAHQAYNTPNWQLFVGDFRTKNEAFREKKRIEKAYPGAFIVSATIQISK